MVEATLSYLAAMPERPFFLAYAPAAGEPARNTRGDRRVVAIADARGLGDAPSLEREGFALVRHETAVGDLWDGGTVRARYYREMEALVARHTGATRVTAFDHNVRSRALAERGERGAQPPSATRTTTTPSARGRSASATSSRPTRPRAFSRAASP